MLPNQLSDRLRLMRWVFAAIIALFIALYQTGLARYAQELHGDFFHKWGP